MNIILTFVKKYYALYQRSNFPRASAAMTHFMTMTFFPLIICLYTLLGNSYAKAMSVLRFAETFVSPETVKVIEDFLGYVARNHSSAMMIAGLTLLATSSSAALRTLQITIGEMQGGQRYTGVMFFLFSVAFSVMIVAALYFGIVVMLTGNVFINWLNAYVPFFDISNSWNTLRFIVFGGIEFIIFLGIYAVCMPANGAYTVWPGALVSTAATVGVSVIFSVFISASAKYPLVYGSLASIILLMFWLYLTCMVIYCGAAINIVIRDMKNET